MRLTGPARIAIVLFGSFCSAFAAAQGVRFNEIHYDNVGTDTGEAIEIVGPAGLDVSGYTVVLYNGATGGFYNTRTLVGNLSADCGVIAITYPTDGLQNGSPDGMALFGPGNNFIEFLSYEGTFTATNGPAAGRPSVDIGVVESASTLAGMSLQRIASGAWRDAESTFGACNEEPPVANQLVITGREFDEVPLPVGFQDQLFAELVNSNNETVPSTFIWTSETPATASIDANGVFTALAAGEATLRATADDGTTNTVTLPTRVAVASSTALYGNNAEFGEPTDADPSDDYIVRYPQYTASYNATRGTPNWVAYDLEATHFGDEDRCNCFTMDPALPGSFPQLTTADYTGSGDFHGYGIDRGHLARSFDRTSGSLDNAYTYLFDNIVPQAADLNQGPWAAFENFLGDEARLNDREVYIIAGVAGNQGTLKNEGRVVIPASTWKVAVIMPHDRGLSSIADYRDLEVIAVNMPNTPGVRDVDWNTYLTTVDAIEALTGYDLLALLAEDVEAAVESNTQPPFANVSGTASLDEGGSASFSGAASIDPNGSLVSYHWEFGDGATGDGASVSHTFAQDGAFTVRLTVTDNDGLTDTATLAVTVANVAPAIAPIGNATIDAGGAHTAAGTFTDPGADAWTATVNFGDGSAPAQAMLSGHTFSLVHVYPNAGTFTVTVTIADDDTSVSSTHTVTVNPVQQVPGGVVAPLIAELDRLVATGKIPRLYGRLLRAQLNAAQDLIDQGKFRPAKSLLNSVYIELDLLVHCRVTTKRDVATLKQMIWDLIHSLPRT